MAAAATLSCQALRSVFLPSRFALGLYLTNDTKRVFFQSEWHERRSFSTDTQQLARSGHGNLITTAPFRKGQARDIIYRLNSEERELLLKELQHVVDKFQQGRQAGSESDPPTGAQLRAVAAFNAMPFIGFGFLDNFIMVLAGDYIDMTIGTALGISTLAAAALGNLVSDVAGIGSAWYVETLVSRIGVSPPRLTPEQFEMRSTRWSSHFGRALGVSLGCLLGMFPLFFLGRRKPAKETKTEGDS